MQKHFNKFSYFYIIRAFVVELTPLEVSKPSDQVTVIDNPSEGTSTKVYDHHFEAMNTAHCNIEPFLYAKKATHKTKKEMPVVLDYEQLIETNVVEKNSSVKNICSEPKSIAKESKEAPNTPLVNKNLKNVEKQPSPRRTRSASKSSKSDENGANLDLDCVKKDIITDVNVAFDIEKQLKTPASKLLENQNSRSSSKRIVKSVSIRKLDSEIEIPNSSSSGILETPKKRSTDKPEPEVAPQTPLINKHLQIGEPRSSARRNVRSANATKETEEKELNNKANAPTTDTPKVPSSEKTETEVDPQTPAANKNSQVVEHRSSTRRNAKTALSNNKDEESEFGNESSVAIIDVPKSCSSDKAEPEVATQTPVTNKNVQVVEPRSSVRRNIRSAKATKETEEKVLNNKASVSTIDTPKEPSNEKTEAEMVSQTPVANKNLQVAEPRSSTRRNVRSAYATKVNDGKELNNKAVPTTIDTPEMRSNGNVETSIKRSARIKRKDTVFDMTIGVLSTRFETPKKESDDKSTSVRKSFTLEPEALNIPSFDQIQVLKTESSAKRDQRDKAQKNLDSFMMTIDNTSTPRRDLAKRSTNDKNNYIEAMKGNIDFGSPATPLVNKNLRLAGTRSSVKRGLTAHDDVMGSASKSLKLDTTEFKMDVDTVGNDSITEQKTSVINESIRVVESRSSTRRNVKSVYATKEIETSTSNFGLRCVEKESNILKTTPSKLNEAATASINQSKIDTAIESNGGEDSINTSFGLSEMLKTPVVKKTLRKNAAKQKAISKLAEPCVTKPIAETIIGNVGFDDSMNSFGLTELLKTPAMKNTHDQIDSRSYPRNAKSNTKSTIQPLKSETELNSPEKIPEMLKSPVAYTSSLNKMVMFTNTTPNKNPTQIASNFVSTPSTSRISPNKATSSQITGQKLAAGTPQSSNRNVGQIPKKSQISPSIKGQTPVQLGNTSQNIFVPYLRPPQNQFFNQSPGKPSNSFSSTEMPNNMQKMNDIVRVGKTCTPNPITQKTFAHQSPAKIANPLNSSFELPKTPMIVKMPAKGVTERKSLIGTDGLYYRSPVKGTPNTISPMKLTIARPNFTPNPLQSIKSLSPKIDVVTRHNFTPNTTPTMLPVQYTSQSISARCRKVDFHKSPMEKHQNQVVRNTTITSQANSSNMMSSTPQLSAQLLPSRISPSYTNASLSMHKGNFCTRIQIDNPFIHKLYSFEKFLLTISRYNVNQLPSLEFSTDAAIIKLLRSV